MKKQTCRILRCDAQLSYICVYQQLLHWAVAIETNGT